MAALLDTIPREKEIETWIHMLCIMSCHTNMLYYELEYQIESFRGPRDTLVHPPHVDAFTSARAGNKLLELFSQKEKRSC